MPAPSSTIVQKPSPAAPLCWRCGVIAVIMVAALASFVVGCSPGQGAAAAGASSASAPASAASAVVQMLPFVIAGEVKGLSDGSEVTVRVRQPDGAKHIVASAKAEGGQFSLGGEVQEPTMAEIEIGDKGSGRMILEGAHYRVDDTPAGPAVMGGVLNDLVFGFSNLPQYVKLVKASEDAQAKMQASVDETNEKAVTRARAAYGALNFEGQLDDIQTTYHLGVLKNPTVPSLAKLFILQLGVDPQKFSNEERDQLLAAIEKEIGPHPLIGRIRARQAREDQAKSANAALQPGMAYRDVSAKDAGGQTVKLSDVLAHNKLVLVDFWASWCEPCRAEMPHLAKTYAAHKAKGFEIVGISVDEDASAWRKAVESEHLQWINLLDQKAAGTSAADQWGIEGLPSNALIDAAGKIVARDVREWDVERIVAKHLAARGSN